jgi:hypothetical protein
MLQLQLVMGLLASASILDIPSKYQTKCQREVSAVPGWRGGPVVRGVVAADRGSWNWHQVRSNAGGRGVAEEEDRGRWGHGDAVGRGTGSSRDVTGRNRPLLRGPAE